MRRRTECPSHRKANRRRVVRHAILTLASMCVLLRSWSFYDPMKTHKRIVRLTRDVQESLHDAKWDNWVWRPQASSCLFEDPGRAPTWGTQGLGFSGRGFGVLGPGGFLGLSPLGLGHVASAWRSPGSRCATRCCHGLSWWPKDRWRFFGCICWAGLLLATCCWRWLASGRWTPTSARWVGGRRYTCLRRGWRRRMHARLEQQRRLLQGRLFRARAASWRGGGGGAAVTRRKRDERLLSTLVSVLSSLNESEADEDDAHTGSDEDGDPEDSLFRALQELVASRPQNVLRALQDFAQGKGRGRGSNPPGNPPKGKGWDHKGKGKGKGDVTGKGKDIGGKGGRSGPHEDGWQKVAPKRKVLWSDVVADGPPPGRMRSGNSPGSHADALAKPRPADWGCSEVLCTMVALEKHVASYGKEPVLFFPSTQSDLEEGLSYLIGHEQAKVTVLINQPKSREGWVTAVKAMAPQKVPMKGNTAFTIGGRVVHQTVCYVKFGEDAPSPKEKMACRAAHALRPKRACFASFARRALLRTGRLHRPTRASMPEDGLRSSRLSWLLRCRIAGAGSFRQEVRAITLLLKGFFGFMMTSPWQ